MEWIDVEDDLPSGPYREVQQVLIATYPDGEEKIQSAYYYLKSFMDRNHNIYAPESIKYWLPIPKVPSERYRWKKILDENCDYESLMEMKSLLNTWVKDLRQTKDKKIKFIIKGDLGEMDCWIDEQLEGLGCNDD